MNTKFQAICIILLAIVIGFFHYDMKERPDPDWIDRISGYMTKPVDWEGKVAPDFELFFTNGDTFKLQEHVGKKVIILNFFTTWCAPCKEEMPELSRFYTEHRDEDIILIGIDCGDEETEVREYLKENKLSFPVAIDKDEEVKDKFGVSSYPTTVVIGVDGTIHLYEVGGISNADVTFANVIKKNKILIEGGKNVDKESFAQLLIEQKAKEAEEEKNDEKDKDTLDGRAKEIAEIMGCPCGCDHIVQDCSCKTADDIKERLKTFDWPDKMRNKDIIKELNKEFCVGEKDDD